MAEQIMKIEYSEVMQKSYIDYAMSVICARALPDIRDGLKPVQRRVLYAMDQLGLNYDKPHRKSARIVGDTMGKYHPHGDSSIYEALVVMEQDFKKGMALVDGHGNFGSIEGDGAAAMRYTEAKLMKFTQDVYLSDLDKNIVDFIPNFDETEKEPEVLPVRVPNILINGAEGIAVGMTTSIPTHNLGEVIDAVIAYMDNNDITTEELMKHVIGPDFPTGALVVNKSDLLNIYETGTGKIKLRGKVVLEEAKKRGERDKLVITEIPYTMIGANIGKFISDIVELAETKMTTDIVDVTNESSKDGIRICLELKGNADVENLKNLLYKKTRLEDTFGVNMLAIVDNRPETLGLKKIIEHHVNYQYELATRKYTTLLEKDKEQKEIKEGLIRACNIIDLIIEVLRGATSLKDAKDCLINGNTENIKFKNKESKLYAENLNFTEKQATAILELRLYRLIGLEIMALEKEYSALIEQIAEYEEILSDRKAMARVLKKDLQRIKKEYSLPRKTEIVDAAEAVFEEKKEVEQQVMFLMDRFGYSKTIDMNAYERNKDAVHEENKYVFPCMNTDRICIFTDNGNLHLVKVKSIPFCRFRDKGTPIDNLGNYNSSGENIVFIRDFESICDRKLLFTTASGMMKLVDTKEFDVVKKTVAATKLQTGDKVVSINMTDAKSITSIEGIDKPVLEPVLLSGGSDEFDAQMSEDMGFGAGFEDDFFADQGMQLTVEFDNGDPTVVGEVLPREDEVLTNEIVVLQTENSMFLRFPLREIPEKKKGAVGVRGIKLSIDDKVKNVYVLDAGDSKLVKTKDKEVDLRSFKTARRGGKGTKVK